MPYKDYRKIANNIRPYATSMNFDAGKRLRNVEAQLRKAGEGAGFVKTVLTQAAKEGPQHFDMYIAAVDDLIKNAKGDEIKRYTKLREKIMQTQYPGLFVIPPGHQKVLDSTNKKLKTIDGSIPTRPMPPSAERLFSLSKIGFVNLRRDRGGVHYDPSVFISHRTVSGQFSKFDTTAFSEVLQERLSGVRTGKINQAGVRRAEVFGDIIGDAVEAFGGNKETVKDVILRKAARKRISFRGTQSEFIGSMQVMLGGMAQSVDEFASSINIDRYAPGQISTGIDISPIETYSSVEALRRINPIEANRLEKILFRLRHDKESVTYDVAKYHLAIRGAEAQLKFPIEVTPRHVDITPKEVAKIDELQDRFFEQYRVINTSTDPLEVVKATSQLKIIQAEMSNQRNYAEKAQKALLYHVTRGEDVSNYSTSEMARISGRKPWLEYDIGRIAEGLDTPSAAQQALNARFFDDPSYTAPRNAIMSNPSVRALFQLNHELNNDESGEFNISQAKTSIRSAIRDLVDPGGKSGVTTAHIDTLLKDYEAVHAYRTVNGVYDSLFITAANRLYGGVKIKGDKAIPFYLRGRTGPVIDRYMKESGEQVYRIASQVSTDGILTINKQNILTRLTTVTEQRAFMPQVATIYGNTEQLAETLEAADKLTIRSVSAILETEPKNLATQSMALARYMVKESTHLAKESLPGSVAGTTESFREIQETVERGLSELGIKTKTMDSASPYWQNFWKMVTKLQKENPAEALETTYIKAMYSVDASTAALYARAFAISNRTPASFTKNLISGTMAHSIESVEYSIKQIEDALHSSNYKYKKVPYEDTITKIIDTVAGGEYKNKKSLMIRLGTILRGAPENEKIPAGLEEAWLKWASNQFSPSGGAKKTLSGLNEIVFQFLSLNVKDRLDSRASGLNENGSVLASVIRKRLIQAGLNQLGPNPSAEDIEDIMSEVGSAAKLINGEVAKGSSGKALYTSLERISTQFGENTLIKQALSGNGGLTLQNIIEGQSPLPDGAIYKALENAINKTENTPKIINDLIGAFSDAKVKKAGIVEALKSLEASDRPIFHELMRSFMDELTTISGTYGITGSSSAIATIKEFINPGAQAALHGEGMVDIDFVKQAEYEKGVGPLSYTHAFDVEDIGETSRLRVSEVADIISEQVIKQAIENRNNPESLKELLSNISISMDDIKFAESTNIDKNIRKEFLSYIYTNASKIQRMSLQERAAFNLDMSNFFGVEGLRTGSISWSVNEVYGYNDLVKNARAIPRETAVMAYGQAEGTGEYKAYAFLLDRDKNGELALRQVQNEENATVLAEELHVIGKNLDTTAFGRTTVYDTVSSINKGYQDAHIQKTRIELIAKRLFPDLQSNVTYDELLRAMAKGNIRC
jgi:hypothetical protein